MKYKSRKHTSCRSCRLMNWSVQMLINITAVFRIAECSLAWVKKPFVAIMVTWTFPESLPPEPTVVEVEWEDVLQIPSLLSRALGFEKSTALRIRTPTHWLRSLEPSNSPSRGGRGSVGRLAGGIGRRDWSPTATDVYRCCLLASEFFWPLLIPDPIASRLAWSPIVVVDKRVRWWRSAQSAALCRVERAKSTPGLTFAGRRKAVISFDFYDADVTWFMAAKYSVKDRRSWRDEGGAKKGRRLGREGKGREGLGLLPFPLLFPLSLSPSIVCCWMLWDDFFHLVIAREKSLQCVSYCWWNSELSNV